MKFNEFKVGYNVYAKDDTELKYPLGIIYYISSNGKYFRMKNSPGIFKTEDYICKWSIIQEAEALFREQEEKEKELAEARNKLKLSIMEKSKLFLTKEEFLELEDIFNANIYGFPAS